MDTSQANTGSLVAGSLEARPAGPRVCLCCTSHTPVVKENELEAHHVWPLGEGGPDVKENLLWLCANTHNKVHNLWRIYKKLNGIVPWGTLSGFTRYSRAVVAQGWALKTQADNVSERTPSQGSVLRHKVL